MLARKAQLQSKGQSTASVISERLRLSQARTLAIRRQDYDEVAALDEQLARLPSAVPSPEKRAEPAKDLLAQVNERNRKANLESVRRAELEQHERKRKLLMKKRTAGTATPVSKEKEPNSRSVSYFFPLFPYISLPPSLPSLLTWETAQCRCACVRTKKSFCCYGC